MIIWPYSASNQDYAVLAKDFISFIAQSLLPRLLELVKAPVEHTEILWILVPLFISSFLMILYFGRHRDEELGWNTAFGNNIALMFVIVNVMKKLYDTYGMQIIDFTAGQDAKIYFVYALLFYTFIQLIINPTSHLRGSCRPCLW